MPWAYLQHVLLPLIIKCWWLYSAVPLNCAHGRMFQWPTIDPTMTSLRLTANKRRPAKEPPSHIVLATLNPELTSLSKVGQSSTAAIVTGGYHTGSGSPNHIYINWICFAASGQKSILHYKMLKTMWAYITVYFRILRLKSCAIVSAFFLIGWQETNCYHSKRKMHLSRRSPLEFSLQKHVLLRKRDRGRDSHSSESIATCLSFISEPAISDQRRREPVIQRRHYVLLLSNDSPAACYTLCFSHLQGTTGSPS